MRTIKDIIVHSSATPKGKHYDINDIREWHINPKKLKDNKYKFKAKIYNSKEDLPIEVRDKKGNGWSDVGYHYVVLLDGVIQIGRKLERQGAGVRGYNKNAIHICYIGGGVKGNWEDTRTTKQKVALIYLIGNLKRTFKNSVVSGHRDFPNVKKACPCFDAKTEYKNI